MLMLKQVMAFFKFYNLLDMHDEEMADGAMIAGIRLAMS
jgi:hypothetical protein